MKVNLGELYFQECYFLYLFLICLFLLTSLTTWWPSYLGQRSRCGKGRWGLLSILTSGVGANYYCVVINLPMHQHRRPEENVLCACRSVWFGTILWSELALKGKGLFKFIFFLFISPMLLLSLISFWGKFKSARLRKQL